MAGTLSLGALQTQELYCSCTPEELNEKLNPGWFFFLENLSRLLHPNPLLQQQEGLMSNVCGQGRCSCCT